MRTFPRIPGDATSALMLFGCAFGGDNDCRYVRAAGLLDVTVVDYDPEAIAKMKVGYPPEWSFVCQDVYDFVPRDGGYDVVVADPWGGDDMDKVHDTIIPRLVSISNKMLVVGSYTPSPVPAWATQVVRNPNYCWWVLA